MALRLAFERNDKYLTIRASGVAKSAEEFAVYAATAADFCDSENCDRLLVDETNARLMAGETSAKETVDWLLQKDLAGRWSRIAAVCNPEFRRTAEMYMATATNKGLNYRLFDSIESAVAWLEED